MKLQKNQPTALPLPGGDLEYSPLGRGAGVGSLNRKKSLFCAYFGCLF